LACRPKILPSPTESLKPGLWTVRVGVGLRVSKVMVRVCMVRNMVRIRVRIKFSVCLVGWWLRAGICTTFRCHCHAPICICMTSITYSTVWDLMQKVSHFRRGLIPLHPRNTAMNPIIPS